jgi:aspartate/methionine/tyrosine aminotransferase
MAAEYQARRDRTIGALQGIPGVQALIPDGGLFVMVDLRELMGDLAHPRFTSDDVRKHLLTQHGVVVLHGGAYGPGGEGLLRVSFAAGGPTLDRGLERLQTGLRQVASDRVIAASHR